MQIHTESRLRCQCIVHVAMSPGVEVNVQVRERGAVREVRRSQAWRRALPHSWTESCAGHHRSTVKQQLPHHHIPANTATDTSKPSRSIHTTSSLSGKHIQDVVRSLVRTALGVALTIATTCLWRADGYLRHQDHHYGWVEYNRLEVKLTRCLPQSRICRKSTIVRHESTIS